MAEPKPFDPQDCLACMEYYDNHPSLVGACASVGISRGWSTPDALAAFLAQYHRRGHPAEAPRG
jgi:hypothetical protein